MARMDPRRNGAAGKGAGTAPKPAGRSCNDAMPDAAGKPFAPAIRPGRPAGIAPILRAAGRKAVTPVPPVAPPQKPGTAGAGIGAWPDGFAIRGA